MSLPRFDDPRPGLVLAMGPGEGDRLVAPGVPDQLLADGERLGWSSRSALVILAPDRTTARVVALDHTPHALSTGPDRWALVHEGGVEIVDPDSGSSHQIATDLVEELVELRPGGALAVLRTASGNRVVDLDTGGFVTLPAGARRTRTLLPWSSGAGLIWIDDDSLYRWSDQRGVAVCGHLPERAVAVVPGPGGSVLVTLGSGGCLVASPGRQAVLLSQEVLAQSASFDAAGTRLLAAVAEGTALFDTRTGARTRLWTHGAPVGFAPDPVRLDDDKGVLLGPDDQVLVRHLGLAGVSQDLPLLVGPGGTVWDLSTGRPAWPDEPLTGGVTAVYDDRVLHVADRDGTLYDDTGTVLSRWRIPLFPEASAEELLQVVRTGGGEEEDDSDAVAEAAWLGDRVVLLTLDGVVGVVDARDGALVRREQLDAYEETDGWPGLVPHRRRGVWLRVGEGGRLLPGPGALADPGEPVEALVPVGEGVVRAVGERLERLDREGKATWTVPLAPHLLAQGRHLFAAVDTDLVLVDAETGRERGRSRGAVGDAEGMVATSDGHLWTWGGLDGEARVCCLDGTTGAHRSSWALPADGVTVASGAAWVWTEDGMLVRLQRRDRYSTVTDLARLRGLSMSRPKAKATS